MQPHVHVLVVDDSEEVCELYKLILSGEGYLVTTANSGEEGFELARATRPDLILLDVVMPGMDGLELLLKLRSDLAPPIPPVILCSGFDLTEDEALRRGAARFLRKPLDVDDLVGAIDDVLEGRAAQPESVVRQRQNALAAREHVLETARDLITRLEAHGAPSMAMLEATAKAKLSTVAAYVGIARGALALLRGDRLLVLAATDDAVLRSGFDLGRALPEAYEVLETGSSLLLPDASAHPFSSVSRALGGVRLFAGVPLFAEHGVPVGVVCLFDPASRRIDAEDLVALQLFGRRGSDLLARIAAHGDTGRLVPHGRGIVVTELFEELLDAELRILDRRGGSMELLVTDVPDFAHVSAAIARAPSQERLIAGALTPSRVAVFKRAPDDSAREQISAILDELRALDGRHTAGVVDLRGGGVRGLAARDLVHIASLALDRAADRGDGLRRVVIEEQVT